MHIITALYVSFCQTAKEGVLRNYINCPPLLAESVSVGVTMRNPLKVPLVMRRVALTWSHSPLPSTTGGGEGARVEVIEKVVVQPLSEKMVSR